MSYMAGAFYPVMAGLVPAIPMRRVYRCLPKRDARHKAGHDNANSSARPYSAGLAALASGPAAAAAALAASSAFAFFSTTRTDQIEPS